MAFTCGVVVGIIAVIVVVICVAAFILFSEGFY